MMQDEHGKSKQTLIMIVDDDAALGEMLSIVLNGSGFETVTCQDGLRAVEMFPTLHPDLVLLDIMLPGLDGVQVAQRIRQTANTPIIMLTAKSDTTDVVKGLEAGADDYVDGAAAELPEFLHCGILEMNRVRHTAKKNGIDLHLTPMEFELLYVLAVHEDESLSRTSLLKQVWGYDDG